MKEFKKFIYSLIIFVDKIFIYLQLIIISLLSIHKKKYIFVESKFGPGWAQLVQAIFYLNFYDRKNTSKVIVVLDYEKLNTAIQEFVENCKVLKIFSIFILINKDFSKYPKDFELEIKKYCKNIFSDSCTSMDEILYNKEGTFFNKKILSEYVLKKILRKKEYSWHLQALNDAKNGLKKKIFNPNKNCRIKIKKIFNLKISEIQNSIHVSIRQRNKVLNDPNVPKKIRDKIFKNISPFTYLRDGNVNNLKFVINYLLKKTNFKIFYTGDIEDIDINHKNFFTYKNFSSKTSQNFYRSSVQTLAKFHITNSGGNSKIMHFNNSKILFIDAWPPVTFQYNSIFLFKNIINRNKKYINCYDYLKMYERACENQKNKNSLKEGYEIYTKFVNARDYKIIDNTDKQILKSIKEFILFISNNGKIDFKNNIYKRVPKYFKKTLIENKCLLSSGNSDFRNK